MDPTIWFSKQPLDGKRLCQGSGDRGEIVERGLHLGKVVAWKPKRKMASFSAR